MKTKNNNPWVFWAPRVLGILVAAFLGLFALDAFGGDQPLGAALVDFAVHLLPAVLVLGIVALAWRWEWVGAVAFTALAIAYLLTSPRVDWSLVISGPLFVVGLLFLWSWRQHPSARKTA